MNQKAPPIDTEGLMRALSIKRTILTCLIFGAISPIAISVLAPFFILFIEGFRLFLESIVEGIGLAQADIALYKLGVENLENTVLSLFLPVFPFDFTKIKVTEEEVIYILTGCLFTLFLCAAASRMAHCAALGLYAETAEDVKKRGFEARTSANRAFFRTIWFIPLVMAALYTLIAMQPVGPAFIREHFQAANFIQQKFGISANLLAPILSGLVLFLFLQWAARLRSIFASILITLFTLALWLVVGAFIQEAMRAAGLGLPFLADSLQNAYALAFYTAPGFVAYVLACILAGLIIRLMRDSYRTKTQAPSSSHWIRGR